VTDFETLLATGSSDARTLQNLEAYYRGAQPLNFLHPDLDEESRQRLWSLVINWPRVVLDALEERLDVEGFRLGSKELDEQAWNIWQDNDLDVWSQQCHLDAMLYGRSFAMVWPSKDDPSKPCITIESAAQFAVEYDPTTRRIIKAAKQWTEGDERFVTLYTPTRVERWYAQSGADSQAEWRLRTDPVPNLYGVVPVVPFVNRPRLTTPMGESELTDVIPLADAINKLATDLMVAAEFHAMPRRWATGMDLGVGPEAEGLSREKLRELWSKAAGDRVWTNSSPDGAFGQFTEAGLQNFIAAIRAFALNIAAISGCRRTTWACSRTPRRRRTRSARLRRRSCRRSAASSGSSAGRGSRSCAWPCRSRTTASPSRSRSAWRPSGATRPRRRSPRPPTARRSWCRRT
jgi:hypothetical protein